MIINQFIKKLNNTELGKGNTHETYVLVPREVDITEIFEEVNKEIIFTDKKTKESIKLRYTVGREKRIVGLGTYYSSRKVEAGDRVKFEKIKKGSQIEYYIDLTQKDNTITFQKNKNGFEILNLERYKSKYINTKVLINSKDQVEDVEIKFVKKEKKRKDSPNETEFYDLLINGNSILDEFKGGEMIELEFEGNYVNINKFIAWEFNKLEDVE